MSEIIAVATITILAVISPGGDFAIVTRNSYLYGKNHGLLTALGIAMAVWIHVAYTLLGVSLVLQRTPALLALVKIVGAIYLIYIGIQTYLHSSIAINLASASATTEAKSTAASFKDGFVTNALNPKTTLFVLSVFSQVVSPQTSLPIQIGYGAFMSLTHLLWFALVALLLSHSQIRNQLLAKQRIVNRAIGVMLASLGIMLFISIIK